MEHVVLLQMEEHLTDEQEKDMLDHLFSLQYYYRGILAVSLGAFQHPVVIEIAYQGRPFQYIVS